MKTYPIILATALLAFSLHAGELADAARRTRIAGGIIVLVNGSDASYADAAGTTCTVHGFESDAARLVLLRSRLQADGDYGRVSVSRFNGKTLPVIDNLVNLVVIRDARCGIRDGEIERVLAPYGTAIGPEEAPCIPRPAPRIGDGLVAFTKPYHSDMDEWNQYLHNADNNGVSADKVGPPERIRWTGGTRWGRSHMSWVTVTSILSAKGRLLTIEDLESIEYHKLPARFYLIARDAFNGCELWRRPLKNWHQTNAYVKFVPTQIQRRMAAIGDKVYCTLGYDEPISVLDAATGERQKTLDTAGTAEFAYDRGVIYAIVGKPYSVPWSKDTEVVLKAIGADTGAVRWEETLAGDGGYIGGTLAVKNGFIAYCTRTRVHCRDAGTGGSLWSSAYPSAPEAKGGRGRTPGRGAPDNTNPTLVLTDDMVYCATLDAVTAYGRKDGKQAWTGKNVRNYMKSSDLFVAGGLVWTGLMNGHDPVTGAIKRRLKQMMHQPMGHDRCYRNRITETYYINSKTGGSDFVPLDGKGEFPSPWVRATCGLGALPCNGMLYASPFSCSCLNGTMLNGFNALYSGGRADGKAMRIERRGRLVKGHAYGSKPPTPVASAADWPVYRNDNARSGMTKTSVDGNLKPVWQAKLPSCPTAPTIVGDLVYIAARDSHTLYALSRKTGASRWTFTAGGRIDSPPAFHKGFLLFGSRDGWVYCLRASDGVLAWRFSDLPYRRLIAAHEQLESAWPINGAVMVRDDIAYFAAGRSSFLDGGVVVYGLNPSTGEARYRRQMSGPYAKNGFPLVGKRNTRIEGFKGGIFSAEDDLLYVRHQAFKPDLTPIPLDKLNRPHLIASSGFLDDIPQHRTYWTIDTDLCYGPNTGTIGAGPKGDILAMDGDIFYEIRGYLPGRHSTKLVPQRGYTLYSGERAAKGTAGAWQANPKTRTVPRFGTWKKRWSTQIPLTGNALIVAGETLVAAGVPLKSAFDDGRLSDAFAGKLGGVLWTASATDGAGISELELPSPPVWDGLAAARGQCFLSLRDGTVMCLGKE